MEIKVEADILKDGDAWHREWNAKRNAAIADLVADGAAQRLWTRTGDLSRDERDDEQMRWLFWRQTKSVSQSERMASPEAYLYEGVTSCMKAARDDERRRLAKVISRGLQSLLGDEFFSVMYDIAAEHDINIGND